MKRCLVILLLMVSCTLSAQIQEGTFLAGGTLSFQSTNYSAGNSKTSTWNLTPGGGYFFIDRFAAGARVSFTHISNDADSYSDILAGPFARFYFLPATRNTNIFLEAEYLFGSEKYDDFDAVGKTQLGIAAGPSFFINPFIAVETVVSWQSMKYKGGDGRYNTLGIGIGFQFHLRCKEDKEGK